MIHNPHGLGRKPSSFDERDFQLTNFVPVKQSSIVTQRLWRYPAQTLLDQGKTGHCVGFSIAMFGDCYPVRDHYLDLDGHSFYYACKMLEGDPQGEDGSTIRTAAKVMKKKGLIARYAFAHSMSEVRYWLLNSGPMIAGTVWTYDMFDQDHDGFVKPTGGVAGGHAWLLEGVREDYYYGRCAWGNWGHSRNGTFKIKESDLSILFRQQGEILAAVEVPHAQPIPSE